jgi:hypothetical protein
MSDVLNFIIFVAELQQISNVKPTNTKPENHSHEIILTIYNRSLNFQQEIENMEVHHHSHHEGKKNWKTYFREFLMLFLAVFCGFLAEYQLEHIIEHDREKQFVESMVADIKGDDIKIQESIKDSKIILAGLDSLLKNIYHAPYTERSLRKMYYLERRYSFINSNVPFTKRTLMQLKNSGGMRLIRNKAAADTIISYDENCEMIEKQGDYFVNIAQEKGTVLNNKIFDSQYLLNLNKSNMKDFLQSESKITLLNSDKKLMKEYANTIFISQSVLTGYIKMLEGLHQTIPEKIMFLEKEYRLQR